MSKCAILKADLMSTLQTRSPFLEAHLSRFPATLEKVQLLWQFYVKNGQFLRAAQALAKLAESTEYVASIRLPAIP